MPRIIDEAHAELAMRAMVGAADVDGGPTAEQLSVIAALARGYYEIDFDPSAAEPLSPDAVAAAFATPAERGRMRELLVFVELCRHPVTDSRASRVEEYCAAMGETGPGLAIVRDLVDQGKAQAAADYMRFFGGELTQSMLEPQLAAAYPGALDAPDPVLAARLRALGDAGPGTLGRAYVEFYERYGFDLPGEGTNMPAVFVSHDMSHVIGGYEPVAIDEIALGAMQLAMHDSDADWFQFLGNLGVHEAGYLDGEGSIVPKEGCLTRPGAVEAVAHAFWRGAQCTGDFTTIDHLARAHEPLADVRASFGIPDRAL